MGKVPSYSAEIAGSVVLPPAISPHGPGCERRSPPGAVSLGLFPRAHFARPGHTGVFASCGSKQCPLLPPEPCPKRDRWAGLHHGRWKAEQPHHRLVQMYIRWQRYCLPEWRDTIPLSKAAMPAIQTSLHALAAAASLFRPAAAVVRTTAPQLGWNSYNAYACSPNETVRVSISAFLLKHLFLRRSRCPQCSAYIFTSFTVSAQHRGSTAWLAAVELHLARYGASVIV